MIELNMTLVAQVINFLIAVVILYKLAYKPLTQAIKDRQDQIQSSIDSAEKKFEEANALLSEYQQKLNDARKESQEMVEKAQKIADESREEILKKTKDDTARMLKQAEEEIAREKDKMLSEVRNQVSELSVLIAGKIIEKTIDPQIHDELVDEFIKEVGDLKC